MRGVERAARERRPVDPRARRSSRGSPASCSIALRAGRRRRRAPSRRPWYGIAGERRLEARGQLLDVRAAGSCPSVDRAPAGRRRRRPTTCAQRVARRRGQPVDLVGERLAGRRSPRRAPAPSRRRRPRSARPGRPCPAAGSSWPRSRPPPSAISSATATHATRIATDLRKPTPLTRRRVAGRGPARSGGPSRPSGGGQVGGRAPGRRTLWRPEVRQAALHRLRVEPEARPHAVERPDVVEPELAQLVGRDRERQAGLLGHGRPRGGSAATGIGTSAAPRAHAAQDLLDDLAVGPVARPAERELAADGRRRRRSASDRGAGQVADREGLEPRVAPAGDRHDARATCGRGRRGC